MAGDMSWPAGSAKGRESQKRSKGERQQLDHIRNHRFVPPCLSRGRGFGLSPWHTENRNDGSKAHHDWDCRHHSHERCQEG